MAITKYPPNTIRLAPMDSAFMVINDFTTSQVATPGHLAEMHDNNGVLQWRKNSSATNVCPMFVYLEQSEMNKTIDDNYGVDDLAQVWAIPTGGVFYGLVPSGQDISFGDLLQSNGDGTLKEATSAAASASVARFQSLDDLGAVDALTRIRAQRIC